MAVIVHYDRGFPTRLLKQRRLEYLLRTLGEPDAIVGRLISWRTWTQGHYIPVIYPGDNRKIIRVSKDKIVAQG